MSHNNNHYNDELSYILNTPPRWIVKYGQLMLLLFFVSIAGVLLFIPIKKYISFDMIIIGSSDNKKRIFIGKTIRLSENNFAQLELHQRVSVNLNNSNRTVNIISAVDSLYFIKYAQGISYYALINVPDKTTGSIYVGDVANCTIEVKSSFIDSFK